MNDTQKVALDIGRLFSTTDITKENGGAAGCMSGATDPECPTMFSQLQVSFGSGSTGLPIAGGAAPAGCGFFGLGMMPVS